MGVSMECLPRHAFLCGEVLKAFSNTLMLKFLSNGATCMSVLYLAHRGALCIPAFEIMTPEAPAASEEGVAGGDDDTAYAPDYNFEDLDYTIKEDFVDTVRAYHTIRRLRVLACALLCRVLCTASLRLVGHGFRRRRTRFKNRKQQ